METLKATAPGSIEDLSEIVKGTNGPIYFGCGESIDGPMTLWRTYLEANKAHLMSQIRDKVRTEDAPITSLAFPEELATSTRLSLSKFIGILDYSPNDQVVKVQTNHVIDGQILQDEDGSFLDLSENSLQGILGKEGQCLPFAMPILHPGPEQVINQSGVAIGSGVAWNLPHPLQSQCGSWRDWILGATLVLADGTIVKCGSKAVKNVAGYDLHRFIVGTRDSLAILVDVTLRTFPLDALPKPDVVFGSYDQGTSFPQQRWTQRVERSDFEQCLKGVGDSLLFADRATCTVWCVLGDSDQVLPRYPGDWVMRSGCGEKNIEITDPTQIKLMRRAKQVFDPTNKLNPGEWGFM